MCRLKTCPVQGPGPLAGAAGSGEVPVSCSADLATQEPVLKGLAACASVSPGERNEWDPGVWGAVLHPGVNILAGHGVGTWHAAEIWDGARDLVTTPGWVVETLGWAGGG